MSAKKPNAQFIKHYKNKYSTRTMSWLILANALRRTPLQLKELIHFAGHSYGSIRLTATKLRRAGALDANNKVNWSSPVVQKLSPPLEELPDVPRNWNERKDMTDANVIANRRMEFSSSVEREVAKELHLEPDEVKERIATLTPERALEILSNWVESGQAGSATPKFVDQIMVLYDRVGGGIAPPEPRSDADLQTRLYSIMDAVPDNITLAAIEQWNESYRARIETARASEAMHSQTLPEPAVGGPLELEHTNNPPESDARPALGDTNP